MRKLFLLFIAALCFNACSPGYVKEPLVYTEVVRPARLSDRHIWRDPDWVYERRTKIYKPRNGTWVTPNRGRTFVPGHWKSTKRGYYWVNGHWH